MALCPSTQQHWIQGSQHAFSEAAYRTLFRRHLDTEAASDIRQALQLGMPVGCDRFGELVYAAAGIRFNSGKRWRSEGKPQSEAAPMA